MKKLLLFALGACLFAACNKNLDNEGPIDASKQKMLMDKAWQLKAYTVNPNINDTNSFPQDQYQNLPDCIKDNYYIFNDARTLSLYDHYQKCTMSEPDTTAYIYSLTNDEKYLTVWSDPNDPVHSTVMYGNMTYPSVDSFLLTWQVYDSTSKITSEYVQTYIKMIPD